MKLHILYKALNFLHPNRLITPSAYRDYTIKTLWLNGYCVLRCGCLTPCSLVGGHKCFEVIHCHFIGVQTAQSPLRNHIRDFTASLHWRLQYESWSSWKCQMIEKNTLKFSHLHSISWTISISNHDWNTSKEVCLKAHYVYWLHWRSIWRQTVCIRYTGGLSEGTLCVLVKRRSIWRHTVCTGYTGGLSEGRLCVLDTQSWRCRPFYF